MKVKSLNMNPSWKGYMSAEDWSKIPELSGDDTLIPIGDVSGTSFDKYLNNLSVEEQEYLYRSTLIKMKEIISSLLEKVDKSGYSSTSFDKEYVQLIKNIKSLADLKNMEKNKNA